MTELTRAQMEILEFERATWKYAGRRDTVILERFGHSRWRHAQIVLHLIDQPAALAYDAQLVNRLRNLRDKRRTARTRGTW
jgi:hypothetical protein